MPNNYLSLSPSDFETLAVDILSALHSVHFERYGEGRDGGVDGKYVTSDGGVWVVQAKRYRDVNALLRQMGHEQKKMQQLPQAPARYFLVTACSLSPTNKAAIQQAMGPFILSTGDIYGAEDLDALLHQYPAIYRKHHRLWLHGVEQLTQYLQRAHYLRAEATYERIIHESKSYVAHNAEPAINQQLATQNSCLIVGDPGIGKSATAGQIALRHLLETPQAELIWIDDRNFEQALQLIRTDSPQIIVMDDFLGATFLHDDGILAFQRDWQALLRTAQRANGRLKLLFTTRNYILEQALAQIDDSQPLIAELCQRAVYIEHNNARFRVELVYNLLRKANLDTEQIAQLVQDKLYWPLIKSSNFSPRLLKMLCSRLADIPATQLAEHIKTGLEGQHKLWQQVFQRLSPEAQCLLYLCAIAGKYANVTELKRAFHTLYPKVQNRLAPCNSFDRALIELEPTFIKTEQHLGDIWLNSANPSLIDFLHKNIADNPPLIDALIKSLEHFDWGLDHFKVTAQSKHPIAISAKQREHLMHKLIELLPQQSSKLMQTFTNGDGALQWVNQPDSFGARLTKLWRTVMSNAQQADATLQQIQFLLPSDAQSWESLLLQGGMQELLDLTRYLAVEQQEGIWLLAMDNLHNSEDAAALAEFYQQEPKAKQLFQQQKRKFIRKLLNACFEEIDRTNDTDILDAIMHDLYRIEEATGVNISDQKYHVHSKLDDSFAGEKSIFSDSIIYYQRPDHQEALAEFNLQISLLTENVESLFSRLGSECAGLHT